MSRAVEVVWFALSFLIQLQAAEEAKSQLGAVQCELDDLQSQVSTLKRKAKLSAQVPH